MKATTTFPAILLALAVTAAAGCEVESEPPDTDVEPIELETPIVALDLLLELGLDVGLPIEPPDVTDVPGCPGGWYYAWSFDGLPGSYTRWTPAPDGELATVTFLTLNENPGTIWVDGEFTRTVRDGLFVSVESGPYSAVPANLLIGSFIGFLDDAGDDIVDLYAVIGQRRNPFTDDISSICIAKVDETESGHGLPFVISRVGL